MISDNHHPLVSILIPIRNEARYIDKCLKAVLKQDYPAERIEILIADGMSDDGTRGLLKAFHINDSRVKLFDNPGKIVASGLNLLTRQAKGEVLVRVDGHCEIAPDYVSRCVHHLQTKNVDGVGGPMHSIGEDDISQTIALAMSSKFGVGGSSFRTEVGHTKLVDTIPFPAYKRTIIDKVGQYDEELLRNQDDEYNYRIREAGGKILMAEDIRSIYFTRGSLRNLWRQYYQYGFYKVRVFQMHTKQMRPRQFIPPLFVFAIIISSLLALLTQWGWLPLFLITGIYLIANFAASLITARCHGCKYVWRLPFAFATLHISYGLGFLLGLIKYWNRWGEKQVQVSLGET